MSFFSTAHAATGTATQAGEMNFMSFLPMIVIFILFWFLLIRPQQRKSKLHNQMLSELQQGDEVVTNGGILGKIAKISEQFISLEVANNVIITMQRNTIANKVEKGTLEKAKA
jgi:preprotein translocase subunit YajC